MEKELVDNSSNSIWSEILDYCMTLAAITTYNLLLQGQESTLVLDVSLLLSERQFLPLQILTQQSRHHLLSGSTKRSQLPLSKEKEKNKRTIQKSKWNIWFAYNTLKQRLPLDHFSFHHQLFSPHHLKWLPSVWAVVLFHYKPSV